MRMQSILQHTASLERDLDKHGVALSKQVSEVKSTLEGEFKEVMSKQSKSILQHTASLERDLDKHGVALSEQVSEVKSTLEGEFKEVMSKQSSQLQFDFQGQMMREMETTERMVEKMRRSFDDKFMESQRDMHLLRKVEDLHLSVSSHLAKAWTPEL